MHWLRQPKKWSEKLQSKLWELLQEIKLLAEIAESENSSSVSFSISLLPNPDEKEAILKQLEKTEKILTIKKLSADSVSITVNKKKFESYYKKIENLKKGKRKLKFILNSNGELYRTDDEKRKFVYLMDPKKLRYKIVHFLAEQKEFVPTSDLASELNKKAPEIRKNIGEIRRLIKERLRIPGSEIVESNPGSGYRIKNVKLKEN